MRNCLYFSITSSKVLRVCAWSAEELRHWFVSALVHTCLYSSMLMLRMMCLVNALMYWKWPQQHHSLTLPHSMLWFAESGVWHLLLDTKLIQFLLFFMQQNTVHRLEWDFSVTRFNCYLYNIVNKASSLTFTGDRWWSFPRSQAHHVPSSQICFIVK